MDVDLTSLSPTELAELGQRVTERLAEQAAEAEEEARAAAQMDDPHGTVRYYQHGDSYPMFLVRQADPADIGDGVYPYWDIYRYEHHGIHLDDGAFDPAEAPVIGSIAPPP